MIEETECLEPRMVCAIFAVHFATFFVLAYVMWALTMCGDSTNQFAHKAITQFLDINEHADMAVPDGGKLKAYHGRWYAAVVARHIKNDLGIPKRNDANDLVIRKKACDIMRANSVRETHISAIIPLVLTLCYMPTREEIMAKAILDSPLAKDLMRQYHTGYGPVEYNHLSLDLGRDATSIKYWRPFAKSNSLSTIAEH
jgi:hypothetical protein